MKARYWVPGILVGGAGAVLAFALEHDDSTIGIRLRPLGVVLLVIGGLFLLWGLVQWWAQRHPAPTGSRGAPSGSRAEEIKSIGGLVAVALGVGAIAALTIVIITTASGLEDTSIVAISTSAFGVVSTVVGAFVGIKVGSDQTGKAVEEVKASATAVGAATAQLTDTQRATMKKDIQDAATLI